MDAIRFDFLMLTTILLALGLILLTIPADKATNEIKIDINTFITKPK